MLLTSFPRINKIRRNTDIDFVYSRIVENNADPESYHIKIENELILIQRYILLKTLKFLDNFEKNFPGKNLVISPHPNENINFWKNYLNKRKFKNIFLNTDVHSSSYPLINASELTISSNSTSILEAHFLEKEKINFLGEIPSDSEMTILKKISKVARSSDELVETIKVLGKVEETKLNNLELNEIKNYDENFDSFESILEKFDKLNGVNVYDGLFNNNYDMLINKLRMLKYSIKVTLSSLFKLNPWIELKHSVKIGKRLKKFLFISNVKNFNSLEKVENLEVKKIAREVFLLDTIDK